MFRLMVFSYFGLHVKQWFGIESQTPLGIHEKIWLITDRHTIQNKIIDKRTDFLHFCNLLFCISNK